jgi:ubiquitin carboxyl-terminal hydrolase L3
MFLQRTWNLSAEERGELLESDVFLAQIHERTSLQGQTHLSGTDEIEEVNLHFITFIEREGWLFELDGRKPEPSIVGSPADKANRSLLKRVSKVIRETYMKPSSPMSSSVDDYQYTILALVDRTTPLSR